MTLHTYLYGDVIKDYLKYSVMLFKPKALTARVLMSLAFVNYIEPIKTK